MSNKLQITFLMPCYAWAPMGGFRIVYEYANRLVAKGHTVNVLHPRRLNYLPSVPFSVRTWVRNRRTAFVELLFRPTINWHKIDPRVRMLYVPTSDACYIPHGDAVFATGWTTARSILELPLDRGQKFYLIQGYESYHAEKDLVDATWRAPLHKIVIANWLLQLGKELGCDDLACIPNGIDLNNYHIINPIACRPHQISMLFSPSPVKGSIDGFAALRIVRETYPHLKVVAFGTSRRMSWVPEWVEYYRDPQQDFIVSGIYNKSKVYMAPSLSEGFPLPPAEAAACGCAIAGTDIGGIREYIEHGTTGLLSPPSDPQALADNVLLLLKNEDLRLRLVNACLENLNRFSWDKSAFLMENYIKRKLDIKTGSM